MLPHGSVGSRENPSWNQAPECLQLQGIAVSDGFKQQLGEASLNRIG
jgi:hypothetical protein